MENSGIISQALAVKKDNEYELLKIAGTTGVGFRYNPAIVVYVETPEIADSVPAKIDGFPVIAWVTGKFFTLQTRMERWRPAPGGVSCGSPDTTAGTLGSLMRGGSILTNNHVGAQDWGVDQKAYGGKDLWQPGPYDGGALADRIGGLNRWVRCEEEPAPNLIDACIIQPDDPSLVTSEIYEVGESQGSAAAQVNDLVYKSGRTTGRTEGFVYDTVGTLRVTGPSGDTCLFEDQIITDWMADGGDSGSVLLKDINGLPHIVGLLFAGSQTMTGFNKFEHVSSLLGVDAGPYVPGDGVPNVNQLAMGLIPLAAVGAVIVGEESRKWQNYG